MVPGYTIIYDQQADIKCCRALSVRIENAPENIQGLLHFVHPEFVKRQGQTELALPWRGIKKKGREGKAKEDKDALDFTLLV